jgi:hypothetical protein
MAKNTDAVKGMWVETRKRQSLRYQSPLCLIFIILFIWTNVIIPSAKKEKEKKHPENHGQNMP